MWYIERKTHDYLFFLFCVASPRSGSPDDFKTHDEDGDEEVEGLTKIGKDGNFIMKNDFSLK